jgi:hypothetical protein
MTFLYYEATYRFLGVHGHGMGYAIPEETEEEAVNGDPPIAIFTEKARFELDSPGLCPESDYFSLACFCHWHDSTSPDRLCKVEHPILLPQNILQHKIIQLYERIDCHCHCPYYRMGNQPFLRQSFRMWDQLGSKLGIICNFGHRVYK